MKITKKNLNKSIEEELKKVITTVSADYLDTKSILELSGTLSSEEFLIDDIKSGDKDSELNKIFNSYDCKTRLNQSSDTNSDEYKICAAAQSRRTKVDPKNQKTKPALKREALQIGNPMKITKKNLQNLIKEEINTVLKERDSGGHSGPG